MASVEPLSSHRVKVLGGSPPDPPNDPIIKQLEALLEMAKTGHLQAFAYAGVQWRLKEVRTGDPEVYVSWYHVHGSRWARLLAGLTIVQHQLTADMADSVEDIPVKDDPT